MSTIRSRLQTPQLAIGLRLLRLGEFCDIDQLTMFADYRVPQILREWNVLQYSDALSDKCAAPPLSRGPAYSKGAGAGDERQQKIVLFTGGGSTDNSQTTLYNCTSCIRPWTQKARNPPPHEVTDTTTTGSIHPPITPLICRGTVQTYALSVKEKAPV